PRTASQAAVDSAAYHPLSILRPRSLSRNRTCAPCARASQHVSKGEEEGGQRAEGGHSSQVVPASLVPGEDADCDGIQPRSLFPGGAHLVSEGRGALSDAGFAALDQQEISHARLRVDRQGQEPVVE